MGHVDGKPMVKISGKLIEVEKFDSRNGEIVKNIVRCDAPDPQSYPQTFAVQSQRQFGKIGDRVEVDVLLNGRKNQRFYNVDLWEA